MTKVVRFPNGETYTYDTVWQRAIDAGDCEVLQGKEGTAALNAWHKAKLLEILKPGDSVYTSLVKEPLPGSGTAHYKVFIPLADKDGRLHIRDITRMVADFNGHKVSKRGDAIVMGGFGYSKGFQIVHSLGIGLWPDGTPEAHSTRNGEPDTNGGYALNHREL
jgi:hypothetical protein